MNMSKQSKPHSSQYCKRVLLANSKVKKKKNEVFETLKTPN